MELEAERASGCHQMPLQFRCFSPRLRLIGSPAEEPMWKRVDVERVVVSEEEKEDG